MSNRVRTLRRRLDAALLDFAWEEWSQMGVLASAGRRSRWAQDPEALILFTLEVARDDPRLFDELLDWLLRNEPLLSVRRLRTFASTPEDRRLVDATLTWVDTHRPRARLRGRREPAASGDPERLFVDDDFPVRKPDPAFLAAGLLRPSVAPSGKAQPPDLHAPINFAFRLRLLLGVGARAEVARVLLTAGQPLVAGAASLSASAGYTRRNVLEAVSSLEQAGAISVSRLHGDQRLALDTNAWARLLGLGRDELPEGRAWPQLLGSLVQARRWLREVEGAELSEYMLASRARDLLEEIVPTLAHAGVATTRRARADSALADVEETINAALDVLA